ncbi:hypothetical protein DPMN_039770 [Dreissena polymorpha]|uniref:Uncharacterized protein n=1 Tax=Dreissena polymorpha TaxID=45954 RepID=A0A9D4HUK3_DREPO|nr:hypothetical protein DPMN_039770 [Dreissena polymorpha]
MLLRKKLGYYMLPKRNLMEACGLDDALQHKWVSDITDMMDEGPKVILRLEKIRNAIVAFPEPMLWFSKKRMEMEMLQLEAMHRVMQCKCENKFVYFSELIAICSRQVDILTEVEQRML